MPATVSGPWVPRLSEGHLGSIGLYQGALAGDMVDERTEGKHADKVDIAQERAKDYLGGPEQK